MTSPPSQPRELDLSKGVVNSEGVCWACGTSDDEEKLDYHHIIPRAFGGEQWATVALCQVCHRMAHELATGARATFAAANKTMAWRLGNLSSFIKEAGKMVDGDANKPTMFQDRMPARTSAQLDRLAKLFKVNKRLAVRRAIEETYMRYIGA